MSAIALRNRQRVRRINTPLLRRIVASVLDELAGGSKHELCIHLVAAPEMARVNKQYLQHEGSTDVITFDYAAGYEMPVSSSTPRPSPPSFVRKRESNIRGEIFICIDDSIAQARQFRTTWQSELVRYIVHGILHLLGHDDLKPAARRNMKVEENRIMRSVTKRFPLSQLARRPKLRA